MDIVGQNYISPENLEAPLIMTGIENVALSDCCDWLATIERRDDRVTAVEMRLKFWHYSKHKNTFVSPHNVSVN